MPIFSAFKVIIYKASISFVALLPDCFAKSVKLTIFFWCQIIYLSLVSKKSYFLFYRSCSLKNFGEVNVLFLLCFVSKSSTSLQREPPFDIWFLVEWTCWTLFNNIHPLNSLFWEISCAIDPRKKCRFGDCQFSRSKLSFILFKVF